MCVCVCVCTLCVFAVCVHRKISGIMLFINVNDGTIWMLRFCFYALFLSIFLNERVELFLPKQEINQKQICQDINNGWCPVVKMKMLVTFFFVLFCIFLNFLAGGDICHFTCGDFLNPFIHWPAKMCQVSGCAGQKKRHSSALYPENSRQQVLGVVCLPVFVSRRWNSEKSHFATAASIWAGPWKLVVFVWVPVTRIVGGEGMVVIGDSEQVWFVAQSSERDTCVGHLNCGAGEDSWESLGL